MKGWRRKVDWQRAFLVLAVLTVISACFAVSSYQAWQGWKGVHSQLAVYAPANDTRPEALPTRPEAVPDVAASLAARNIQLLSWQQSGRERSRQTLVLSGTFADLLTWLNDWPASCPQGSCQIFQWERGEAGSVVTVELSSDGKTGAAFH